MIELSRLEKFIAGLPLVARRKALRLQWRYDLLRGRPSSLGLSPSLRSALKLSMAESIRVDREAYFADRLYSLEWLALLVRSPKQIVADWAHVSIPSQDIVDNVATSGRPVILAPIHMGCFALPFAKLIYDVFPRRPMLILRAREDRLLETQVMRRISEMGVEMRFLNVNQKQDYIDAIRFARTGSVIVSFVDLPGSYGSPVATTLFGQTISLAMGLDSLARLTDASVVPMAIHSSQSGDVIHVGRPFEISETGTESRHRVVRIIRNHLERSVQAAPEQWFMWQRLNEFLIGAADHETIQ